MKKKKFLVLSTILIALGSVLVLCTQEITGKGIESNSQLTLEQLRSLPYIAYTEEKADKAKTGVILYNKDKAFDGYNLYESTLMDMEGNIIKKWPGKSLIKMLDNGDIIASNNKDKDNVMTIGKYAWDNDAVWERKDIKIHHEISLSNNNTILAITKEVYEYNGRRVEFDVIVELDQDGNELFRWSTWENFDHIKQFHKPTRLNSPKGLDIGTSQRYNNNPSPFGGDYDYYHLNSIQILPETPLGKKDKRFQKGNWLICLKHVNLIAILDKNTKEIVWSWGAGKLEHPHMPRMLDSGNILIFDNGTSRKYSRVIELNPLGEAIVWEYKAGSPEQFFSETKGSCQKLPNGNILMADSDNGRAFEVTKTKDIVWEWYNPQINEEGKRGTVYRMIRYSKDKIDKIVSKDSHSAGKSRKL